MEIQIQSPQNSFIVGESIRVELILRNTGAQPIALPHLEDPSAPQPYFVVQGPSFPKSYRFHWRGKAPAAGAVTGQLQTIAPGQTLSGTLSLPASVQLSTPGPHDLYASYEWNGATVESNRIKLKIEEPSSAVFHLVGRAPLSWEVGIQALHVSGQQLYLATFSEQRPDMGETKFIGLARLTSVDLGAADFFAPWCQIAQAGEIGPRFGWRNGNALTVAGYSKLPQRIDLPFTPKVYKPSLMSANGDIDVFVTDGSRTKLALVRFPNVGYNEQPPPAKLVWSSDLPEPISALAATINPSGTRFAVLRQGNSLRRLIWDDSGPKLEPAVQLDGRPVDAVSPAVHASGAGVMRASVVTADANNARKFSLTEITWKPGASPEAKAGAPFDLQSGIRSGTVAYSMKAVEAPRRDWFFILENRRVQSSNSGGKASIAKNTIPDPPQLLVGEQITYNLEVRKTPALIPID